MNQCCLLRITSNFTGAFLRAVSKYENFAEPILHTASQQFTFLTSKIVWMIGRIDREEPRRPAQPPLPSP